MHNHNNKNNSSMWWMMILCTLPLVLLLLAGGKLFSAGYLWPILIVGFIAAHFWVMLKGHRSHNHDEDSQKDGNDSIKQDSNAHNAHETGKSKQHGGCCH